jgi:hypothetical protein
MGEIENLALEEKELCDYFKKLERTYLIPDRDAVASRLLLRVT